MGGAGYSLDLGTQMSTSGDAQSSGSFSFGGVTNTPGGLSNFALLGVIGLVAILALKK